MDKKKITIISAIALIVIIAIVGVIALTKGNADNGKETETTTVTVADNDATEEETKEIETDETVEVETESSQDFTEPSEAETEKEIGATDNLVATEDYADLLESETTSEMKDEDVVDNTTTATTKAPDKTTEATTTKKEETTTKKSAATTTTKAPEVQTEEPTTTTPKPAIASGWKADWVTEYYATYVKKYINRQDKVDSEAKATYDAICSKYLNSTFGCSAMISELEAVWEYCSCEYCMNKQEIGYERDKSLRNSFSDSDTRGAQVITVSGYGSDALALIESKNEKSRSTYMYLNIYYDSATNTTTAYICTAGGIIETYWDEEW